MDSNYIWLGLLFIFMFLYFLGWVSWLPIELSNCRDGACDCGLRYRNRVCHCFVCGLWQIHKSVRWRHWQCARYCAVLLLLRLFKKIYVLNSEAAGIIIIIIIICNVFRRVNTKLYCILTFFVLCLQIWVSKCSITSLPSMRLLVRCLTSLVLLRTFLIYYKKPCISIE